MTKYFFLLLLAASSIMMGCEKSFEEYSPTIVTSDTVWSTSGAANFLKVTQLHEELRTASLTDSFTLSVASTINFIDNVKLDIPANAFVSDNGTLVDGKAKIEVIALRKKGDFIRFQKQTVSNGYLLESGAMVYVQVTKNGTALSLGNGKNISINFRDPAPTQLMSGFAGVEPAAYTTANFTWTKDSSNVFVGVSQTTGIGYNINTTKTKWINCARFNDTGSVKSRIALSMPKEYTNGNTTAWIVYKNNRSVMQMEADVANRIWLKTKVPINRPIYCVTITKRGTDYYFGVQESTSFTNQNIEMRPEKKTLQEISTFLDAL